VPANLPQAPCVGRLIATGFIGGRLASSLAERGWDRFSGISIASFRRVQRLLRIGDHTRTDPNPPDFFDGWWGYVSKDLRALFGPAPRGAWTRIYCGGGSKSRCRALLRHSLREALQVGPAALYGHGDCADDPQPSCYDKNRSVIASAIAVPPAPFQNRPTFQQTVSVQRDLP
jgi:hypothetical protein